MNPERIHLQFDDLVCGYGDTIVVRGLSGRVQPGRVLGVLGRNGVGKSTLIKALAGHLPVMSGRVALSGADADKGSLDLTHSPAHARLRHGIAYAPQDQVIFSDLTVQENLWLHLPDRGVSRYQDCLTAFPRLAERAGQRAGSLSGGERKLLSFTRTLGHRSAIALLDEPTEGVAPENIDRMAVLVNQRKALGHAALIVEQNLAFLEAVADDVLVLDHGECVLQGRFADFGRERLESHLLI